MTNPVAIAAVILAAGRGARMGGPKALLRMGPALPGAGREPDTHAAGSRSFLAHVAAALMRPGVSHVVAVLGHEAPRVARDAGIPSAVHVVHNPRYDEGMLGSVRCGLDAAEALAATAVLLHPVDHPLVAAETVDRVVAALQGGAVIAVPSHDGHRGHPGGFSRIAWPALRSASLAGGARAVLQQHPEWIVHVQGDPGCLAGIDTPADYRRLVGGDPF